MRLIGLPSAHGCLVASKGVVLGAKAIKEHLFSLLKQANKTLPHYEEIPINTTNIAETFTAIETHVRQAQKGTIFLGGDHSVTYPIVKGIASQQSSMALVIFDAHPDCVHNFSPPTQEDIVRVFVDEGILLPSQIFLVGLRAFFPAEKKYLVEKKIRCYSMDQIFEVGMHQVMDALTEQLLPFKTLYVSVDIDCLDPAFAPGVDYPEPGGLSSRELMYAITRLAKLKSFSYLDIVEVNPEKDNGQTALVVAKMITSIL